MSDDAPATIEAPSSAGFYAGLPLLTEFSAVADPARYAPLPADWHVATCDVRNSTQAVQAGNYKNVNTVGAAAVTAMLNAAGTLDIPGLWKQANLRAVRDTHSPDGKFIVVHKADGLKLLDGKDRKELAPLEDLPKEMIRDIESLRQLFD